MASPYPAPTSSVPDVKLTKNHNKYDEVPVPGKVTLALLPPCKVCGEKASGFHYGVNTCEACKGFFRRCLVREVPKKCSTNKSCAIVPGKRHSYCAACRYKKCIEVGMSKCAIKTGRYTHEKKTRNIEEVKQLEMQSKANKDVVSTTQRSSTRDKELDQMIQQITAANLAHGPQDPQFFAKLAKLEEKFLERRKIQDEMFGTLRLLTGEEYHHIYKSTGIDVDGRRELVAHMIPTMELAIKRFINFAKSLPGFKDLPTEDQISIIKASHTNTDFILKSHLINAEKQVIFCPYQNDFLHLEDFKKMFPQHQEPVEHCYDLLVACQLLDLTIEEQSIMGALYVMSTPILISHVGWMVRQQSLDVLGEAMLHELRKTNDQVAVKFGKIIHLLTEMQAFEAQHMGIMEQSVLLNYPGIISTDRHSIWCEVTGLAEEVQRSELQKSAL